MQEYKTKILDETKMSCFVGACKIYSLYLQNPNSYDVFVKFYDKLTANVTIGTTSTDYIIQLPANGCIFLPYNNKGEFWFSIGVVAACTKLYVDTDTTAIATDIIMNFKYE